MSYRDYSTTNKTKIDDKQFIKNLKIINSDYLLKKQYLKSYLNLFDLLGYNLNSQYIYAVTSRDKFNWLHTTTENRIYEESIWNIKNKCYEYIKKPYNINEHLLYHLYPLELKRKPKNKINYIKYDMCGCDVKDKSDILIIDIDCHDEKTLKSYNTAYTLINHFKQYLYIERSYESGYHLYIKLDKQYTLLQKREYLNQLKKQYSLDNIEIKSAMRFPFSYHYMPSKDLDDFQNHNLFEIKNYIQNNYNNQSGFILYKETIEKSNIIPIVSKIFNREKKSTIKHISTDEFLKTTNIFISAGNRNNQMLEICRIGKFNNWSYEEIKNIILQLDQGSNDLKKWSDNKLLDIIENICDKSKIYYKESITTKPDKFISNINIIPQAISEAIQNEQFIKHIIKNCNYKLTELNKQKFKIVLSEMIGYIYYDCYNNRQVLNNKTKYIIGKQFSSQYSNLMSEFYSDKFNCIDCHSIIKSILKYSQLFSQYKINSRGWYFNHLDNSNNFCKQYDFINNFNHYLFNNSNIISYLIISMLFKYSKLLIIQDFFINNNIINEYLIEENNIYLQNTG